MTETESVSLSSLWTPDHLPWLTQVLRREAPARLTYPVCFSPAALPANLEIGALIPVLHLSIIPTIHLHDSSSQLVRHCYTHCRGWVIQGKG